MTAQVRLLQLCALMVQDLSKEHPLEKDLKVEMVERNPMDMVCGVVLEERVVLVEKVMGMEEMEEMNLILKMKIDKKKMRRRRNQKKIQQYIQNYLQPLKDGCQAVNLHGLQGGTTDIILQQKHQKEAKKADKKAAEDIKEMHKELEMQEQEAEEQAAADAAQAAGKPAEEPAPLMQVKEEILEDVELELQELSSLRLCRLSAAEILKHNGWSWTDIEPADRTKVFEDLLKDCYEREGITTQQDPPLKKEHPTNPLLNKYYYIHRPEQAKTKKAEMERSEVRVDTGDIHVNKMNLALGNKEPEIKLEPSAERLGSWKLVDSSKSKVSKEYEAIISLFNEHQNPGKDMKKILDDLQEGLNRVGKEDQAKAKALCQKLTDWKEKGSQHLDGLKALKRRIQALLEG
eukprot:s1113_g6.t1